MPDTPDQLLDALFAAITAGDIDAVAAIFYDDITVWHNVTDRTVQKDRSLAILRYFVQTVSTRRYEIIERRHWPGGAMQRHVVHGCVGEKALRAPVCITFGFRDDKIAWIDEYVDSAAIAPLMAVEASRAPRT